MLTALTNFATGNPAGLPPELRPVFAAAREAIPALRDTVAAGAEINLNDIEQSYAAARRQPSAATVEQEAARRANVEQLCAARSRAQGLVAEARAAERMLFALERLLGGEKTFDNAKFPTTVLEAARAAHFDLFTDTWRTWQPPILTEPTTPARTRLSSLVTTS